MLSGIELYPRWVPLIYPCERSLGNKITDLICFTERLNNTEGIILRTEHLFVFFVIQEEESRLSYLNRVTDMEAF